MKSVRWLSRVIDPVIARRIPLARVPLTRVPTALLPLAGLAAITLLAGCSSMGGQMTGVPAPSMSMNSAAGAVLTDQHGMTLYTYDEDNPGASSCTGLCAAAWPPLMAQDGAQPTGHLAVISRPDGSKQWAKDGMPLYTYSQDKKPGDIRGEGLEGTWHIVRPD
ncbi:MAG TPA: hypothetical protein VM639_15030 [Dongiaceae bacterium]|nr:hypothetical protein [Dongiaceae bacterium]